MRIHRTLAGLIVPALLGLAPLGLATSSEASEASVVKRQAAIQAAGARPEREVSSKIVETQRNKLILKGNVNPGHAEKSVFIQKRNCLKQNCNWYQFNKVQTNKKGGYSSRVTAPRKGYDYWRAKVKAHGGYATSYSEAWRTYTI